MNNRTPDSHYPWTKNWGAGQKAGELGGTLFVPPMDIPGIGRFCGILSPQGVRFYAIKYLPRLAS